MELLLVVFLFVVFVALVCPVAYFMFDEDFIGDIARFVRKRRVLSCKASPRQIAKYFEDYAYSCGNELQEAMRSLDKSYREVMSAKVVTTLPFGKYIRTQVQSAYGAFMVSLLPEILHLRLISSETCDFEAVANDIMAEHTAHCHELAERLEALHNQLTQQHVSLVTGALKQLSQVQDAREVMTQSFTNIGRILPHNAHKETA